MEAENEFNYRHMPSPVSAWVTTDYATEQDRRQLHALRSKWMRENSKHQAELDRMMDRLRDKTDRPAPERYSGRPRVYRIDGLIAVGAAIGFLLLGLLGECLQR